MENRYYIYCYMDPRRPGKYTYDLNMCFLFEPFYIGKGTGDRCSDHIREVLKSYKPTNKIRYGKIKKIVNECQPLILILENNMSLDESYLKEIYYISKIGRIDMKTGPLSNLTGGGEGGSERSELTRKHFSKIFSGSGNPMYGRSRYGIDNPFFNKNHSKKSRELISRRNKGKTPWNKGIKYEAVSGEKSGLVMDYKLISPDGDIIIIKSCYFE